MKVKNSVPPKAFLRFFQWFCDPSLQRYIEGDLIELYEERLQRSGKTQADIGFIADVLLLFRPGIIRPLFHPLNINHHIMFKSNLKIGWRNLWKNKGYSFINIGGLAAGMTVAILIGLWIYDEVSYDRSFKNHQRIARVMQNQTFNGQVETWFSQAMQLGPELRNNYGNNFDHVIISSFTNNHKLTYGEKSITKPGNYMEAGVTEMLTLTMLSGTRAGLVDMHSVLLSQSTAKALFGDEAPIEKTVNLDNDLDVKVTGVYEDLPANSSFADLKMILPWDLLVKTANLEKRVGWGNSWFQCFVQIAPNTTFDQVSARIKDAKRKQPGEDDARVNPQLFLHPMTRWHLHSGFENGVPAGGDIQYVWMFGVIGTFVLILACINFMNLSTARSEKRAKEVGIRKTIGSVRAQLISQFFMESLLVALSAFVIAIVLVQLTLPWFNEISGKQIFMLWGVPGFWTAGVGFAILTGLIAGSYPALYLSSFQPVKVLKGTFRAGRLAALPRKVLVVLQFAVSVTLIIGTIVVFRQIRFAQQRPIGYAINGLVTTPARGEILDRYEAFRHELINSGAAEQVAVSEIAITGTDISNSGFDWNGKDPGMSDEFVTMGVVPEYGNTIGWQIVEGKDFSRDHASDSSGFIVNETAVKYMGLKDPIGEVMKWGNNGEWKIIGITKDIVSESPFMPVRPMIFFLRSQRNSFINFNVVNIKLNPSVYAEAALAKIESIYKKYDPANAFEYKFADQDFAAKFNNEKRVGKLALVFTVLAIFISGLGLLGLASFVAEQKTKEIGIRKILGASTLQLWQSLSKDFVMLVVISCVMAIPVAFFFMNNWLMQYELRISLTWHIFAAACSGALVITLLIVSFQTLRAAIRNPVSSLRWE